MTLHDALPPQAKEKMTTASLGDDEIEERYFLLGQMEILNVLNELILRREPVTVYFNGGRDFFLTTLLEARPDAVIFDPSGDLKANMRLPQSPHSVFVARLNGVRVQFAAKQSRSFLWGGSDAFWVPLPERVVRLQRRESYRILLPVAQPLMVKFFTDDGLVQGEWPAHDLSVTGLGIAMSKLPQIELYQRVARVTLMLPKQRGIDCAAVVRHVTPVSGRTISISHRVGIAFDDLPPAMGVGIQRYITKIEHERRRMGKKSG